MNTLHQIYAQHQGKLSDKWSRYLDAYEDELRPWRDRPVRMLEIGVQNGGSLEIWPRYFPNGTVFVGCDIDPACAQLRYEDPRVHLVVGDANLEATRAQVLAINGEYDIVLDDGSHTSIDIVRSFANFFPRLSDDGVFIGEDLHCSYWMQFGGGLHHPHSAITFFKHMADVVNHEHWGIPAARAELMAGFSAAYGVDLSDELLSKVHSVTFANSLCFVRKRPAAQNMLGRRILAGGSSVVVASQTLGSSVLTPDQALNPFSQVVAPTEERLPAALEAMSRTASLEQQLAQAAAAHALLQADVKALRSQLDDDPRLKAALAGQARMESLAAERIELIHAMQRSLSWRLTAPLRFALRAARAVRRRLRSAGRKAMAQALSEGRDHRKDYEAWIAAHENAPTGPAQSRGLVSVVVPVCNTPERFLNELFASLTAQSYDDWELCIHDDASDLPETQRALERIQASSRAVRVSRGAQRSGISAATNAALQLASGEWIAFVDHDDLLAPQALAECVEHLVARGVEVVYTDHDMLDLQGRRCQPYFKPDFNLDLLLSQMYIGHLVVARCETVLAAGGLRSDMDGAQDYDLMLRMVSAGAKVGHVPKILYHWRQHAGSTAANAGSKPYAHDAGRRAVQAYLDRLKSGASAEDAAYTFCYDVRWRGAAARLASIIIPTRDGLDLLEVCIRTLVQRTRGVPYEILVVDNGSREPRTLQWLAQQQAAGVLRVLPADVPFNWSALNNLAAREAKGDVLVFLNNDTEFNAPDWLERLCENAMRPEVGCCGPLLTYGDGTIQHAGVVVGMGGWADHVFKGLPVVHDQRYFTSPVMRRDVLAVTGACVAISTEKFNTLGGFDESFIVCGSDVELCLRAHHAGLLNVYVAESRVVHHESKTRDPRAIPEQDFVRSAESYEPFRTQGDPFYNPNLDRMSPVPALEPRG